MLRTRAFIVVFALFGLVLGLSACGNSDNDASTAITTLPTAPAPAPVQSLQTTELAYGSTPIAGKSVGYLICSEEQAKQAMAEVTLKIKPLNYQDDCQLLLLGHSEPSGGYQLTLHDLELKNNIINAVVSSYRPQGITDTSVISRPYLLLSVSKDQLDDREDFQVIINDITGE